MPRAGRGKTQGSVTGSGKSGRAMPGRKVTADDTSSSEEDEEGSAYNPCSGLSMEEEAVNNQTTKEKLSFHIDQQVLLKWADGRIFNGKIKTIDHSSQECEVYIDGGKTGIASFSQIYHGGYLLRSIPYGARGR